VSATFATRVRQELAARPDCSDWIRTALVYGVPLGSLLLEADAANLSHLPMATRTPEWRAAYAKAEALTGKEWRIGEMHEIAIRHLWGLWTPADMHEWRVFRNMRAEKQVDAEFFS
jgi:hypothetical protein